MASQKPKSTHDYIQTQIQWQNNMNALQNKIRKLPSNNLCPYTIPQIMDDIVNLHNTPIIPQQQQIAKRICQNIKHQQSFWTQAKGKIHDTYYIIYYYSY